MFSPKMRLRPAIVFAGLITVAGSGCAIDDQTVESGPSTTEENMPATTPTSMLTSPTTSGTESSESAPPIPEVYDWTAPLVGGGLINLAGYSNKAVVLWFWAPY